MDIWRYIKTKGHPYKDSSWRTQYERIAKEFSVSPDYVYKMAHGKEVITDVDRGIKDELIRCGVVYITW